MGRLALGLGILIAPGVAAAHPDHFSGGDFGLVHVLTDPFHLALAGAAIALAFATRRAILRRQPVRRANRR